MRRQFARAIGTSVAIAAVTIAGGLLATGSAVAQVTTTTAAPVTTTTGPATATTLAPAVTTSPATAPTATTAAPTASTLPDLVATENKSDSSSSIPWLAILLGLGVLAALVIGLVLWSRTRGQRQQAADDWRHQAAATTADIGATTRLLAGGTVATAAIAQQLIAALRGFDDLEATAPDEAARAAAQRGRRIIQTLGVAIDADHQVRRAQPPEPPDRVEGSAAQLQATASDADRALRALYRGFTETG